MGANGSTLKFLYANIIFRQVHKCKGIHFLSLSLSFLGKCYCFNLVQLQSQEVNLCFRRETDYKTLFKAVHVWRFITSV